MLKTSENLFVVLNLHLMGLNSLIIPLRYMYVWVKVFMIIPEFFEVDFP